MLGLWQRAQLETAVAQSKTEFSASLFVVTKIHVITERNTTAISL